MSHGLFAIAVLIIAGCDGGGKSVNSNEQAIVGIWEGELSYRADRCFTRWIFNGDGSVAREFECVLQVEDGQITCWGLDCPAYQGQWELISSNQIQVNWEDGLVGTYTYSQLASNGCCMRLVQIISEGSWIWDLRRR